MCGQSQRTVPTSGNHGFTFIFFNGNIVLLCPETIHGVMGKMQRDSLETLLGDLVGCNYQFIIQGILKG